MKETAGEEDKSGSGSYGKAVPRRNSSMSDAESNVSHQDSFHSPLPSESPHDPASFLDDSDDKFSKALVLVDQNQDHLASPRKSGSPQDIPPVVVEVNKLVKEKPVVSRPEMLSGVLRRQSRKKMAVGRVALALRVIGAVTCLISFSVLAADKNRGWTSDSFDRYIEYRYCLVVNIIGFVYSSFQAIDTAYRLATGKSAITHLFRPHFNFTADQILAYLLISASSSAATRVEDWISNWGEDEFTTMARVSISISFLAFTVFSITTLISGYLLCNNIQ